MIKTNSQHKGLWTLTVVSLLTSICFFYGSYSYFHLKKPPQLIKIRVDGGYFPKPSSGIVDWPGASHVSLGEFMELVGREWENKPILVSYEKLGDDITVVRYTLFHSSPLFSPIFIEERIPFQPPEQSFGFSIGKMEYRGGNILAVYPDLRLTAQIFLVFGMASLILAILLRWLILKERSHKMFYNGREG